MTQQTAANHTSNVFAGLASPGIVPVLAFDAVETAVAVAEILLEAGLPVLEVTFRTPAAAQVVAQLARRYPALTLGAGTLLSSEQVRQAVDSGAQFGVSPGLTESTLVAARKLGLPFLPGVATPTEIERGLAYGLTLLKWFPAGALGGAAGLALAAAPYLHTGLRFIPTGGPSLQTLADYLGLTAVHAVGGGWMVPEAAVRRGDWDAVRTTLRAALATAAAVRAPA